MGGGHYAIEDTGGTYQAGTSIADMAGEATTLTGQVKNAADNVEVDLSGQFPGQLVLDGIADFKRVVNRTGEALKTDIQNLGNNTAQGASTTEQTQNETTTLQNGGGNPVNRGPRGPIAV